MLISLFGIAKLYTLYVYKQPIYSFTIINNYDNKNIYVVTKYLVTTTTYFCQEYSYQKLFFCINIIHIYRNCLQCRAERLQIAVDRDN